MDAPYPRDAPESAIRRAPFAHGQRTAGKATRWPEHCTRRMLVSQPNAIHEQAHHRHRDQSGHKIPSSK